MKRRPAKRFARLFALAFALFATPACRTFAPPFSPPESGGPSWVEVKSAHFDVDSDLDAADARAVALELDRMYVTLQDVGFPYETKPTQRMRVIVFRSKAELDLVSPNYGWRGFFKPETWLGGEGPEPVAMFYGSLTSETQSVLRHELTHRFVHFYYPKAPVWLNEGFAHYFETLSLEDGHVTLGRQPEIATLRRRTLTVPRARAIMSFARADLDPDPASADTAREREERLKATNHRAAAWAFVHVLKNGPEVYRRVLDALLVKLAKGADFASAFDDASGFIDVDKLDADLAPSLHAGRVMTLLQTAYTPPPSAIEHERQLPPVDVHVLWASIWPGHAAEQIDVAVRLAPDAPLVLRARAFLLQAAGDLAGADRDLSRAASLSPDDPLVLFDLFHVLFERSGMKNAPPTFRMRAEALLPKLRPLASSAYAQDVLAQGLLRWGRIDEAVPLALRSIQTDAGCWSCRVTLAVALALEGQLPKAVEVLQLAIDLMPETVSRSAWSKAYALLTRYRAAARMLLSDAVVRTIVKRGREGYERCYAEGLARDPRLEGRMIVRFVVDPSGAPSSVTDEATTLPDKQVVACVLAEASRLRFPQREGGSAQAVDHPFAFSPSGAAPDAASADTPSGGQAPPPRPAP